MRLFFVVVLFNLSILRVYPQIVESRNKCLCFYFNNANGKNNVMHWGIYGKEVFSVVENWPITSDSMYYFSPQTDHYKNAKDALGKFYQYDAADYVSYDMVALYEKMPTIFINDSVFGDIVYYSKLMQRRHAFDIYYLNRLLPNKPKGLYLRCFDNFDYIYLQKYSGLKEKINASGLNVLNRKNINLIQDGKNVIKILYSDTVYLAYPAVKIR